MTSEAIPRSLPWVELYLLAMLESDQASLPPLLDTAIEAILDQMEETLTQDGLEELNYALNGLRLRRKEVNCWKVPKPGNSEHPKAA